MSAVILILPHHPDHDPLNLDLIGIDENRLHRRVRRMQADLAAHLAVELLQGDVRSAQQRDDHLAVVHGLAVFDDDEIAIPNLLVDHGVAAHAQHVGIALTDKIFRDGKGLVRSDGFNGQPGRDVSQQWQLDRAPTRACRDHFNRAAAIPRALDEALFLKIGEVFVHCGERRQAEAAPDFFQTRRVPMLSDELGQVVQDLALAFGQWKHRVLASAGAFAPQAKAIYAKGRRRSITASPRVSPPVVAHRLLPTTRYARTKEEPTQWQTEITTMIATSTTIANARAATTSRENDLTASGNARPRATGARGIEIRASAGRSVAASMRCDPGLATTTRGGDRKEMSTEGGSHRDLGENSRNRAAAGWPIVPGARAGGAIPSGRAARPTVKRQRSAA